MIGNAVFSKPWTRQEKAKEAVIGNNRISSTTFLKKQLTFNH